jgi:hypothetical protein
VTVRIGTETNAEQRALAGVLVRVERLARPAQRRQLIEAIWDTYGIGVPSRRATILRSLLAAAEHAEAAAWRWSAQAELTSLAPVAKAR